MEKVRGQMTYHVRCMMIHTTEEKSAFGTSLLPLPVLYCTVLYCIVPLLRTPSLQDEDKASDTMQTQHYDTSDHIRSSRW